MAKFNSSIFAMVLEEILSIEKKDDEMTPQQQAAEIAKQWRIDGIKAIGEPYIDFPSDVRRDLTHRLEQVFLIGHAAGIQAERERIWAEIDNNWQGTSWRMLVKRIIFGEQP